MSCPSELTLATHADGASPPVIAAEVERHVAGCADCRDRLAWLRSERGFLAHALAIEGESFEVPAFEPPRSRFALTALTAAILLGALLVDVVPALLADLFADVVPDVVRWLDPFDAGVLVTLTFRTALFLAESGGDLMTSFAAYVAAAIAVALLAWMAWALRKRVPGPLLLALPVAVTALLPSPGHALEIRRVDDGHVLVTAGETIDDTLVAMGETVEIDGSVTGDVVAVGRRVVIRGRIGGHVFTGARSVDIDGEVDGSVIGAGETITVTTPRVGRNLYAAGQSISVAPGARIEQNALVAAERVSVAGPVGRDLLAAAESLDVNAAVGRDVTAYAEHLTLLGQARVARDVNGHVTEADHVTISPGAVVGGQVNTQVLAHPKRENEYATGGYYVAQLLRFAAAFATGAVVLALFPGLRRLAFDDVSGTLTAAAAGIVTLVAAPVIAILVALTIVGLPLGLIALVLWGAGIYLAKVVVAHFVGGRLLRTSGRHFTVPLALGLALILVTINLPFVGGVLNFVLTVCGLGAIVLYVWQRPRGVPA